MEQQGWNNGDLVQPWSTCPFRLIRLYRSEFVVQRTFWPLHWNLYMWDKKDRDHAYAGEFEIMFIHGEESIGLENV